ncbi:MAG: hypothetical protein ABSG68_15975, partial [Thermoguttaceae bacterium]
MAEICSSPLDETIAAIASPPGGAARGIVRLSGPRVWDCLAACFQTEPGECPESGAAAGLAGSAAPSPLTPLPQGERGMRATGLPVPAPGATGLPVPFLRPTVIAGMVCLP